MPSQSDYGKSEDPEIQLVPDTLRTYRHFGAFKDEIWPMSQSAAMFQGNPYTLGSRYSPLPGGYGNGPGGMPFTVPGCDCAMCASGGYNNTQYEVTRQPPPRIAGEPFRADCRKVNWAQMSMGDPNQHKAPQKECSCGFYAHYSPTDDFYQGTSWTWDRNQNAGTLTEHGINKMVMVRAVVEMSGTVVLGERGVRAEKMKVVAFSPDWGKFDRDGVGGVDRYGRPTMPRITPRMLSWDTDPSYDLDYYALGIPNYEEVERAKEDICNEMWKMGKRYGIEFFQYNDEMYKKYPQPDIDHLKPKPAPEPEVFVHVDYPVLEKKAMGKGTLPPSQRMWGKIDGLKDGTIKLTGYFDVDPKP